MRYTIWILYLFPFLASAQELMISHANGYHGEFDLTLENQRLNKHRDAVEEYQQHIQLWNTTVQDITEDNYCHVELFLDFMMNRYAARIEER